MLSTTQQKLKIRNCKLKIIFFAFLLLFIFVAKNVDAAVLQKPSPNLGLVGYWSMNEGTSTVALDYSGNKNTGTLVSGPTWVDGKRGKALNFDGSNDYVNADSNSIFNLTSSGTVSAWIKTGKNRGVIASRSRNASPFEGWEFRISHGGGSLNLSKVNFWNGTDSKTGTISVDDNNWHSVVVTFDGTNVSIYVDGSLDTQVAQASPNSFTGNLNIGTRQGSTNAAHIFNGLIDEVRVYNRALSAGEIQTLYNSGAAKFAPPNNLGLVGYWSMNEGTSTVALDYSGNKNKGTLVNGPTWVDGKRGKAINFDGANDFVDLGDVLNLSLPISVSAWVKLDSLSGSWPGVVFTTDKTQTSAHFHSGMWLEVGTTGILGIDYGDNTACGFTGRRLKTGSSALALGKWYHIAGVIRGAADMSLYINGVDDGGTYGGTGGSIVNTTRSAAIGRGTDCSAGSLTDVDGLIDEVRVYNRALSATEIQALYNSDAAKFAPPNNLGLVGYWSMNEGTSTVALDYSGNKNKGTLVNGPTWVDGKRGKALKFDGGDDYVTIQHNANQLLTEGFTISAWINPRTTGGGTVGRVLEKATDNSSTAGYGYFMSGSAMRAQVNAGSSRDSGAISLNTWTHVVVTITAGATVTHYINGVQSGTPGTTGALSGITTTNPILIGQSAAGARQFNGLIDEVRVYNRALSADEIKKLYESR